ncbi:MAG: DinB family protein [Phycisphaeraceae bacterium]|nr:DinB family protein [Phycisphaeraceae bacterium]
MNVWIESLLLAWQRNADYGRKLVADLTQEQMLVQPAPATNHPAWVMSHLIAYHGVLLALLQGKTPDDPLNHRFGMKSKPETDASLYPSKDELLAAWVKHHEDIAAALAGADESLFDQPMPLERWKKPFPKIGSLLGYVMIAHEGIHLGQLSTWRRVQGLPAV